MFPIFVSPFRLENNIVFNVLDGRQCEPQLGRDFKISINELIAFLINSEAKFTKVYREGTSKCFLMPAEFSDDIMRNFFRVKFEQFVDSSGSVSMKDDDYRGSFLNNRSTKAPKDADFAEEHLERRKAELEYSKSTSSGVIDQEESDIRIESSSKYALLQTTNAFSTLQKDDKGISSSSFNREVERAQKHAVDPWEVCLKDWEVRDKAQELLEKLLVCIEKIISRKSVGCDFENTEAHSSKSLFNQIDLYFELLRKTNEESESTLRISQILENTVFVLEDIVKRVLLPSYLDSCTEVDKQLIRDRIEAHTKFYLTLGTHSTSLFYEKNQIYQNLKTKAYKVCCVCGTKSSIPNQSCELKDAIAFKELLVVEDRELAE